MSPPPSSSLLFPFAPLLVPSCWNECVVVSVGAIPDQMMDYRSSRRTNTVLQCTQVPKRPPVSPSSLFWLFCFVIICLEPVFCRCRPRLDLQPLPSPDREQRRSCLSLECVRGTHDEKRDPSSGKESTDQGAVGSAADGQSTRHTEHRITQHKTGKRGFFSESCSTVPAFL